jgi:pyridoxamine 5'-phosphate oxidase
MEKQIMAERTQENPIELFKKWFAEAQTTSLQEPTSVALATVTPDGKPSVRIVLLKKVDERGFVFYTNLTSQKGQHLAHNPYASLCFHWDPLRKQVRVVGKCEQVPDDEADAYFASRARVSQIGAWASKQSQELGSRFDLERRIAKYTMKFGVGAVPRPSFWSGFRLTPESMEFWVDRKFRLHDRYIFERDGEGWTKRLMFP